MGTVLGDAQKAFYEGLRTGVSALVRDAANWLGFGLVTALGLVFGTQEGRDGVRSSFPPVPSRPPEATYAVEGLYHAAILAATGCVIAGTLAGTLVGLWLRAANIAIIPRECGRGRWLFWIGLLLGFGVAVAGLSYFVSSRTLVHSAMLFDPVVKDEVLWPLVACVVVNLTVYSVTFAGGFVLTAPKALRIACTPWPLCHVFRVLT